MDSRNLCRRKEVSGRFPEYGAIFMSNRSTLEECFEKSLLGLPGSFSGFVQRVKAGMILFLFEFEERKLYGVFKAISDGTMNIVPHAYTSSGRSFPAQVKFTTICHCDPLFENEFRDAIQDNYFDTHKFNFGLSKDQIQSLLWLFNSRKVKIPNSHHHNKRKNKEQDFEPIEGGLKKGRLTEIQISKRKLNMDHGISVIAEPEVERLSLSSDSCRKSESIHFDDDAYDPEHPGFDRSVVSGTHFAAGHESHELLPLQQKEENLHIFAEETEDYIPLFSPDHSDFEEEGFDFNECSEEKQMLGMFVGNKMSLIPLPQIPLGDEGYNQMKMDHPFASPHGTPCYKVDESSFAAHSMADADDFQSKDGSNHFKSLLSKGMYSDKPKKRTSVFSRLDFSSKNIASKNQNGANGKKLVNDMSRARQQCHDNDECEKMERVTQQKHEVEDCTMDARTSVFLRLTSASDAVGQQVHCMTKLEEGTGGWKNKSNFSEWKQYYKDVNVFETIP
ncbi:Development/cell death domain [Sesbania bispinosa]|nr:Development/cell death domain [Sesbania bispinosa]